MELFVSLSRPNPIRHHDTAFTIQTRHALVEYSMYAHKRTHRTLKSMGGSGIMKGKLLYFARDCEKAMRSISFFISVMAKML